MRDRLLSFRCALALVAVFFAGHASAQIYKWVDDNGVTHYSDTAPEKTKPANKLDVVAERISVYPQDPSLMQQMAYANSNAALASRVANLEHQLQAERMARQYAAAASQVYTSAYDQCGLDCDGYGGYYPYVGVPVIVAPVHHHFSSVPRTGGFVQSRGRAPAARGMSIRG